MNEEVPRDEPRHVWHYCDSETFEKIIVSKKIWLADPRFTNDPDELRYSRDLIQRVVQESLEEEQAERALAVFEDHLTLMTCFSAEGDLLSQWSRYADGGRGFALGVTVASLYRLRDLKEPSRNEAERVTFIGPRFDPLIYERGEQERNIRAMCEEFSAGRGTAEDIGSLRARLLLTAPFMKHDGFSEELEWRLCSSHISLDGDRTFRHLTHPGYCVSRDAVWRYEPQSLKTREYERDDAYGSKPVLGMVRIGPQNRSAAKDVERFLQDNFAHVIPVHSSRIRYRD